MIFEILDPSRFPDSDFRFPDSISGFEKAYILNLGLVSDPAIKSALEQMWNRQHPPTAATKVTCPAAANPKWTLGDKKSAQKWQNQMQQRGWTPQQIDDAIANGQKFPAPNDINPANGATRYINPQTGRSVVIDNTTGQVIHVGGDGFKYK